MISLTCPKCGSDTISLKYHADTKMLGCRCDTCDYCWWAKPLDDPPTEPKQFIEHLDDNERWLYEVLIDYKIPFSNHKMGRRLALQNWMHDHKDNKNV
jgi:hypothetical protein